MVLLLKLSIQCIGITLIQVNQSRFRNAVLDLPKAPAGSLQNHVGGAIPFLGKNDSCTEDAGFYYYRDKNGNEIDLIMIRNGKLTLIECKAGMTYDSTDVKAFERLSHSNYEVGPSCLICLTEKAYPLKKDVYALPVTSI